MTSDMAWWKSLNTQQPLVINHNSTLMDVIGETGNRTPVSAVRVPRANHQAMRPQLIRNTGKICKFID